MSTNLQPYGPTHLAILASVPLLAAGLVAIQRKLPLGARSVRFGLAAILLVQDASYYLYFVLRGEPLFPRHMPLELCDASLLLVVIALVTLKPTVFDLAYYTVLAGASMSLLTPNLEEPFPSFITVQYFVNHGLMVTAVVYLAAARLARPRPGSVGKTMLAVNLYAVFVGVFDFLFKTDYMFLGAKPKAVTLLTILGPWPWYILVSEPVALALFLLLYLPFRRNPVPATAP